MVNPGPCSNGKSKEDGDDGNEALGGGGGGGGVGAGSGGDVEAGEECGGVGG
jgi:hypothetical protein